MRPVRARYRILFERGHLARAAPRVDREAAVALPRLRHQDREPRQRSRRVVAVAPRTLPQLRNRDLAAIPRRSRSSPRCSSRRSARASRTRGPCLHTSCSPARSSRCRSIDLEHYILPNRILYPVDLAAVRSADGGVGRAARLGCVRARRCSGASSPSRCSTSSTSFRRAAWASATCGSRSCSGSASAGWVGVKSRVACSRDSSTELSWVWHSIAVKVARSATADSLRPLPGGRHDDLRALRGTARRLVQPPRPIVANRPVRPKRRRLPRRARYCGAFALQRDEVVVDCCP